MKVLNKNEVDILITMGRRLRELRDNAGLTQLQVGQALDLKVGTISGHESGRVDLNFITLLKYSEIYKISFTEMMNFISEKTDLIIQPATQNPFYKKKAALYKYIEYIEAAMEQSQKRESQVIAQNLKISIGLTTLINEIKNLMGSRIL